ncbi:MAG: hypothetical protein WCD86_02875 [Ktedonobacteraceae bacterium]
MYEWQSEEARRIADALEEDNGYQPDLDQIDVSSITPLDALNLLYVLQKTRRGSTGGDKPQPLRSLPRRAVR